MEEKKFNLPAAIIVSLTIIIALVVVSLLQDNSSLKPLKQLPMGQGIPAPDFTFPGPNGERISLSDHRGKVVLVNVWATWCPPCVEEMPSIEKLYKKFKGEKFEILAVSIDAEGAKAVAPFMKKHRLTFPALLDPEGTIKTAYRVTGVPESFIIDKGGILVGKIIGARDWAAPEVFKLFRDLIQRPLHGTEADPSPKG
jgi:peroxiredoxin